ncbi:LarC family nickel insertion protein [Paenibacillus sp. YIM B09110]|uniref:LarC family nickel insertion protein n=1 Tax=Paenibacillus sp. YIM B09110 TaxID=3126102 RepID=UPI00301BA27D
MKTLYIDCFSGISGDMFIGALLDAGGDLRLLREELNKLHIHDEYELTRENVNKNGITAVKFDVVLQHQADKDAHVHEHTHEHVHSHDHSHTHEHDHSHDHNHDHDHGHVHPHTHDHHSDHVHHHHHHEHRAYKDIVRLIEDSALDDKVKQTAFAIFRKIGEAEGKIHGIPLEYVHFHEVGAVDSIVDIVGAAILIHQLQITKVVCSAIPVGIGKIRIDHGIYPVPAPATLEMLKGIPIEQSMIRTELTTPTGAAIAAVLAESFGPLPSLSVEAVGYGAGTKNFQEQPNVLRVMIGQ